MNLHTLKSKEVSLVSGFLYDLYSPLENKTFADHIVDVCSHHLRDYVTGVAYDETSAIDGSYRICSDSIDRLRAYYEPVRDHISEHPGWRYVMNGGKERILNIHDFVSEREFRGTGLYQEAFRHIGSEYQFAAAVIANTQVGGLTLHRDRPIQESLRPLLAIFAPHIERACELAAASAKTEGQPDPGQLTRHGLTMREAEVLVWVIQGKRDAEIALILDISSRTVSKHMERILSKLNVETRGAAVAEIIRMNRQA